MSIFGLTEQQVRQIEEDFAAVPGCGWRERLEPVLAEASEEEALCLKFLYAYMPASDLCSYLPEFFLKVVKDTLSARSIVSWGKEIQGEMFLNYVLPIRLNNEDLTDHRERFFAELYPRIKALSMHDAILEINYWCLENATYHSTDDRTSSPLGVLKKAYGRCGEESVLTVSALRSVGIPARQCYTPRWAHCDDNHAWVEVWAGDRWHWIGACEPEPVLDKGWFVETSKRGMLVHARAFTRMISEPEVTNQSPVLAQVNILDHYAPTKRLEVEVTENGRPVEGAEVQFQLVNFSELYPIMTQHTDKDGKASFVTGYGELYVQVLHNGKFLFQKADQNCTFLSFAMENAVSHDQGIVELDLVPPVPAMPEEPPVTPEMQAVHEKRVQFANANRNAIEDRFFHGETAEKAAAEFAPYQKEAASFLEQARGNGDEILAFLKDASLPLEGKIQILSTIREKDFADTPAEILASHLRAAWPFHGTVPEDVFAEGILCPRMEHEMITAFRQPLAEFLSEEQKASFQADPRAAYRFVQETVEDCGDRDYATISARPAGLVWLRYGSAISRDLLFVAICRTLGVPARLSPLDKSPEYWKDGGWQRVCGAAVTEDRCCTLTLRKENPKETFGYTRNITIAREKDGVYQTLGLWDVSLDGETTSYQLEEGYYRVLTANRQPDGSILAEMTHVELKRGTPIEVVIRLREPDAGSQHGMNVPPIPAFRDGKEISVQDYLEAGKPCAVAFVETGKEPTEHLLNEILEQPEAFGEFEGRMVLVCTQEKDATYPLLVKAAKAAGATVVMAREDSFDLTLHALCCRNWKLPLVMSLDENSSCIHYTSGYNVGTGDWLLSHFRGRSTTAE